MSRPAKRDRHIAERADGKSAEVADTVTDDERLEAEAKGRRTATDVKTSGERLKDEYRG
jgi:uncharacterized protein YjbJ (UPF0337 family)